MSDVSLKQAALQYAELGWKIFALKPGSKEPLDGSRGFHDATSDPIIITGWWANTPDANIGLACDSNGLVVVDIDSHKPDCGWQEFELNHEVPDTLQARSARGGTHLVFKASAGAKYPGTLCKGVDVKHKGYIVAWPSTFDGGTYQWTKQLPTAQAPEWLELAPQSASQVTQLSIEDVRTLLEHISPDDDYHEWVSTLMAIHAVMGGSEEGLTLADDWSAKSEKYRRGDVSKRWTKFRAEKGIGTGTLFKKATHGGGAATVSQIASRMAFGDAPAPSPDYLHVTVPGIVGEYLTVQQQADFFAGIVYIADRNAFLTPAGIMKPEAFKAMYSKFEFQMSMSNTRPTRNAVEAFNENRAARNSQAHTTVYRPDLPFAEVIEESGKKAVNIFRPAHDKPAPVVGDADVKPFLDLLAVNFPFALDQGILLDWMAWVVQYSGTIARWSPVLQGTHGCGKGLLSKALQYCVGDAHTAIVTPEDLSDKFSGYLVDKCLIAVDEIGEHSKKSLVEIAERLKPLVSDDRISVRAMRRDAQTIQNTCNWFFTTNHLSSMFADDPRERRWCALVSALQATSDLPPQSFYSDYVGWWENGGCEAVRGFLAHRVVENFPNRAPESSSTQMARDAAESDVVRLIREMVRDEAIGFRGGFVSSVALRIALREDGIMEPTRRWFAEALKRAGFPSSFRSRYPILGESFNLPGYDPSRDKQSRVRIYHCLEGNPTVADYEAAQRFKEAPKVGANKPKSLSVQ